jgi:hypothetical protein
MTFALAEIAEFARMPKRSVRLWADAAVIKADEDTVLQGSGIHRRFSRTELIVACIIAPFAKQKLAIGALNAISRNIRLSMTSTNTRSFVKPLVEGAILGEANFLRVHWSDPVGREGGGDLLIAGVSFSPASRADRPMAEALTLRAPAAIKVDIILLDRVLRGIPAE